MSIAIAALLSACKVPDDPEHTTQDVTGSVLKVGALTDPLDPVEADVVTLLAGMLQAEPEVVRGDPHGLFAQLEAGKIHVVAGRIPSDTPFAADVALTDPLGQLTLAEDTEDRVLAIQKGENRFLGTLNRAIREVVE
ncbi:MAG TPA: enoyl-CoA hydratase [Roseovarius sp.]